MTENEAIEALRLINTSRVHPFYSWEEMAEVRDIAISALKEIQQYHEIGTVEECREAREKQIPKAPIMKPYYEDMPDEEYLCCPTCGDILTDRIPGDNKNFYFHCLNCGQKFDWGEKDD